MKQYVFAYYGEPKFKNPDDGKKHMAEWGAWMKLLGKVMVNPGVPLKATKTVSFKGVKDSGGSNRLTGYSVIEAKNFQDAVKMAKKCPHLKFGTIDVGEAMDMKM